MTGLLLRLAAPMQSWGERGVFGDRDTAAHPTRSGMLGLLAAASGIPRGDELGGLTELDFIVRVDRPGVHMVDYHTVGGGYSRRRGIPTADGGRRNSAIITDRHYLADAVFTVACVGPDSVVDATAKALRRPHWQPYLGRRSCPPEQPMMLGMCQDAESQLRRVPLPRWPPRDKATVGVHFLTTATEVGTAAWTQMLDDCDRFPRADRRYRPRSVVRVEELLPSRLCFGDPATYRRGLAAFMEEVGDA